MTHDPYRMSRMLSFDLEGERFMYRVAGVAVIDGRVLVHQFEGPDDFYVLPGGRVEMREPAEEALAREMREELGCEVPVGRLLWVIDNLFTHREVAHHELGMYFAIALPEGSPQASGEPWTGTENVGLADREVVELYFQWKPVEELASLDLKPSCLRELLRELPEHTQYVVHRDV
jgi:8-oxo-dGTP pyrophosphatase MutT (NUDIX family)